MEVLRPVEPPTEVSPLASARARRSLTVEEAAALAGLSPDEVTWLEEGRVYRFPSADRALLAALLYSSALGIGRREAQELAGLPPAPAPDRGRLVRLLGLAALAAALAALVAAVLVVTRGGGGSAEQAPARRLASLPAPWQISVDVLNGSGDINYTRRMASRIGALGYQVARVTKASRFDYPQTAVYYEPGGRRIGERLSSQLAVAVRPLPGGRNPRRLVVIVGPPVGPD